MDYRQLMDMKRSFLLVVFFLIPLPFSIYAQDVLPERKEDIVQLNGARPDIPGILGFDFGFNQMSDFSEDMKIEFMGSRYFSGYYKYTFNINNSFSFHPGVSVGTEKFQFNENIALQPGENANGGYQVIIYGLDSLIDAQSFKKSQLATAYIEIPLEITFRTNPNPKKAFKFTVGGKAGYLIDSKMKIKYKQDDETKIMKDKQDYGLTPWRFSITGRIAFSDISLFYHYSVTELFKKDKGPLGITGHPMNFGISLNLF